MTEVKKYTDILLESNMTILDKPDWSQNADEDCPSTDGT